MYKAIVFDLYGTLLDIHTDENQEQLWDKMAFLYATQGATYSPDELKSAYIEHVEHYMEKKRAKGEAYPEIDILKVFKALYSDKGVKAGKRTVNEAAKFFRVLSLDYVRPYPGAVELLELLKESGVQVILLSNAQEAFTMTELEVTGIRKYFDGIYLSSQYKVAKPSKVFFEIMLRTELLTPDMCLFIGNDHTTDIEGANRMGMESIYIHTNCSPRVLPHSLDVKLRIDSGDIFELIEWFQKESIDK